MKQITTPIKTDSKEAITNLQAALVFLLSKQSLTLTADELNALQKQWQTEQQEANYGDATTKLVAIFQQQYNVDDTLGIVEEPTANKLNELLKALGAFDDEVKSPVEKKLEFFKFDLGTNNLQQEAFYKIYTEKSGDWKVISAELNSKQGFTPELIKKLEFTQQVANWTDDNASLIKTFQEDPLTNSLADIAGNYNRKSFADLVNDKKALADGGAAAAVADDLYNGLFQLAPTAMVKNIVQQQAKDLFKTAEISEGVNRFLDNVKADYNLKTTSVYEAFAKENAFDGIAPELHEQVKNELKSLQRVSALSPTPEVVPVLMKANITTSLMVSDMPEDQFVETIAGQLGENGEAIALKVHFNAVNARIRNEQVLISLKELNEGTGIAMVDKALRNRFDKNSSVQNKLSEHNLSWEALLGDANFCECGECTSVYSAAAYYVELLQYLRNNNLDTSLNAGGTPKFPNAEKKSINNTPLEKLFARRPDLGCLQLTCKNTNTILPYVDLVNEVMESYVAFDKTLPFNVTEDETSGELLSQPQHTEQTKAYQLLSEAVYPFTLPYHQPIDAARIYLNYLGTSRYEMINTFRSPMDKKNVLEPLIGFKNKIPLEIPDDNQKFIKKAYNEYLNKAADAEYLGLTQEEYIIITQEAFVSYEYWSKQSVDKHKPEEYPGQIGSLALPAYYGYVAEKPYISEEQMFSIDEDERIGLTFVKDQFLNRTGIQYLDLVELLKTQSLNPNIPEGQALDIMQKIQLSYRFLQTLVNHDANDLKLKYGRVLEAVSEFTNPQIIAAINKLLGIDDPCNKEESGVPVSASELEKWVYNHFENIGKIIVLDNGSKCIDGKLSVNRDNRLIDTGIKIESCRIINSNTGEEIGSIDKTTGLITLTDAQNGSSDWSSIRFTDASGNTGRFVNRGDNHFLIIEKIDTCDLDTVRLIHLDGTPLTVIEYDHIHRFIRVWRKLGWSINETDSALVSFRKKDTFEISPQLLHQIVAVKKLSEQTGLELIKLLCFWTNISTVGEKSLYKRLFLTHNLLSVDSVFHDKNGIYLAAPFEPIANHFPVLMAALNLSADDIEAIQNYNSITDLTLENVSLLYRYRLLSKTLGLRVTEFISVIPLFDNPFKNADATLLFLEKWRRIEDAGFDSRQLNYIIAGKDDTKKPLAPSKLKMLQLAKTLYDGINTIEAAHPDLKGNLDDINILSTTDLVKEKAALLYDQASVEKIMGLLEGTTVYSAQCPPNIKDLLKPLPLASPTQFAPLKFDNYPLLAKKIKYDGATGSIQIMGILTELEEKGSPEFFDDDIIDLAGLVKNLTDSSPNQDKVSAYLFGKFSPIDQQKLNAATPTAEQKQEQLQILISTLNSLLAAGISIYDPAIFMGIKLSVVTENLWLANPTISKEIIRLNRLLLEDAYPNEIEKDKRTGFNTICANLQPTNSLKNVVADIKKQQTQIVSNLFTGVFTTSELNFLKKADTNDLPIDPTTHSDLNTAPAKRANFLKIFLPYLRNELIHRLIINTVSSPAGLKDKITELLVNKILAKGTPATSVYALFKDITEATNPNSANLVPSIDDQYIFIVKKSNTEPLISLDGNVIPFTEQTGTPQEWWSTGQLLKAGNLYKLSRTGKDLAKVCWKTFTLPNTVHPIVLLSGWAGYLIPSAGEKYTFVVRGILTMPKLYLGGIAISFIKQNSSTNEWWSDDVQKLDAGKIYDFSLSGINPENLFWKTATSATTSIPSSCLLPVHAEINTVEAFTQLQKAALLIDGYKLSIDEIQYLDDNKADFGDLDFNKIGLDHFLRLESYTRLRNSLPQTTINILEFFNLIRKTDGTTVGEKIAALIGWKKESIDNLIAQNHLNISEPVSFYNEVNLLKLQHTLQVADKIGMSINHLFDWANPISDFENCRKVAVNIEHAIRAKYSQEDWEQVVKPLSDKLRENQKNALIAFLLVQPDIMRWGVIDADGLFEYFLIDVQMDACMETSRIVQAISSVQLFVQRCFLGLEKEHSNILPNLLDRKRWDWMQRYRVWEANRKVFLYPENWIESNLRDDKSPFFKELESELLQKDINKQNVEDALKGYLYKVDEVANMEVVGVYIEEGKKLHVFSRTRNAPYFFFYRYLDIAAGNWYPWEKMQVDIPSYDVEELTEFIKEIGTYKLNPKYQSVLGNGCFLTPIVWNNRLLIFFPQFMRRTKSNEDLENPKSIREISEDSPGNIKPIEYWEIKMAWSEYRNGKWTQKQLSKNAIYDFPIDVKEITDFRNAFSNDRKARAWVEATKKEKDDADKNQNREWVKLIAEYSSRTYYQNPVTLSFNPALPQPPVYNTFDGIATNIGDGQTAKFYRVIDSSHPYMMAIDKYADANSAMNEAIAAASKAAGNLQNLKLPPSGSDIAKYEFVQITSPLHGLLAIQVYSGQINIGVFEFNGADIKTPPGKTYPTGNFSRGLDRFHHYGPSLTYNMSAIASLQMTNDANKYFFDDRTATSFTFIFGIGIQDRTNIPFHHSDSNKLLGEINSQQLEPLFKFPVEGIDHNADKNDVFGGYDDDQNIQTPNIYHELKRPYSIYNWELFFHTPMMLADALSKSQQFEEAMKWFHYVFNPVADGQDNSRFWQFIPFKDIDAKNILDKILNNLKPNAKNDDINEWRNNPFKPHLVARSRPVAYMKWVVMKYIDNLVAWGDYLFRQDTIESVNEATQLYVLAGHILGPRPQIIPKRGKIKPQTYLSLLDRWDAFSNAMTELELAMPYSNQTSLPVGLSNGLVGLANVFGFSSSTYFCVPNNPKLMGYWDTIADRLFKIRHCENIEGVFRKLPLFEPSIDPALLVKAAALGLSIASVLNDLNTPMPNYRFYYLLQKALELCGELKSMGSAMLSAMEKKDNEAISLIRAKHESGMHNLVMEIKKQQLEESEKALEGLQQNRKSPVHRMQYYLKLIGEDEHKVPGLDIDFSEITNGIKAPVNESGLKLSEFEKEDMDKAHAAADWQIGIGITESIASIFHAIPTAGVDAKPIGIGAGVNWGGPNLGNLTQAMAKAMQTYSSHLSFQSSHAAKKGGFQRALQERVMQANAAGYEIKQIDKQILSQQIRISIANLEITNHQKQIDNANEIETFLKNKYSNEELYSWMKDSLSTLYHQVYGLAFDLAKKAEKTYRFERGLTSSSFINAGCWDAGRNGLLAGENLYVGLKQLEAAYQEKRGYDFEVTKHISLRQVNPLALLELKENGSCEFEFPEVLFDMDYPGHYMRRLKSVSVSMPCIAGPYTSINATLRLLKNKFRISSISNNANDYLEKTDQTDERFSSFNIPISAIAVSSAQNDGGLFELNFKDERYLPFEGAGVISQWQLELPSFRQFNYDTISDVIMHVRYVSSEGGDRLQASASGSVTTKLTNVENLGKTEGLFILIDLKHDLSTEWHKAMQLKTAEDTMSLSLEKIPDFLPYYAKIKPDGSIREFKTIKALDVNVIIDTLAIPTLSIDQNDMTLISISGKKIGKNKVFTFDAAEGKLENWTLKLENMNYSIEKIYMVVHFSFKEE